MAIPEFYEFGGVDARSNPLQMPKARSLRQRNWIVKRDGHLSLRKGYTEVAQSAVTATAIHSPFAFQLLDGTKYLVYFQGTTPKLLNLATNAVTTPTVKDGAFASGDRFCYYTANNRLHAVNGTDQKWFDGTAWRNIGIRPPTAAEVAAVEVAEGVRELTSAQATSVGVGQSGGGSFAADTAGRLVYVAIFDETRNEVGPATINVGSGRIIVSAGNKIDLTFLPNLSSVNTHWLKLLAITDDNGVTAHFCTNTSATITSAAQSGNTVTVDAPSHGLTHGDTAILAGQSVEDFNGVFQIAVVDADHVTFTLNKSVTGTSTGGTIKRVITIANAATSGTIAAPTVDTSWVVNQDRGLVPSSVGGAQPGHQFYLSLYRPDSGEHVGNRIAIGKRFKNTVRCNVVFSSLPSTVTLTGSTEYVWLVGRTGDGAEVPYIAEDSAGNWCMVDYANAVLSGATIDGASEMPTRNGLPPSLKFAARVGERIVGAPSGNKVFRSESELTAETGDYVGRPEQSWPIDNVDIFPTGATVKAVAEYNYDAVIGTLSDCAVWTDQQGIMGWQGPWNMGIVAPWAFTKGWKNLPYWITGDKQLATITEDGPIAVSDEYEASLLAKIGDSYLTSTEVVYVRNVKQQNPDGKLFIKARDKDGVPFVVVHDFNLRDARSPYGQGYEYIYTGPLATDFTICKVRDANDKEAVYACASNGRIYQLDLGDSDAGTEFTADNISLLSVGSSRPTLDTIEWYGDENVRFELFTSLDAVLATPDPSNYEYLNADAKQVKSVFGEEQNSHYEVDVSRKELPEHVYLRITLTSHSADAPADGLTDPPHMPLSTYGQLFMLAPNINGARPRG